MTEIEGCTIHHRCVFFASWEREVKAAGAFGNEGEPEKARDAVHRIGKALSSYPRQKKKRKKEGAIVDHRHEAPLWE